MSLSPFPIRLFCDLAAPTNLLDLNRSQPPQFYRGDDIEIDIGLGQNGSLLTSLADSGVGGIAAVTAQLFQTENDTNSAMLSCTVPGGAMNLSLTQANWNAGGSVNSHAQFIFSNGQTAISLNGAASVNYWLRITAQTTDSPSKTITLLDGPITVKDGPLTETQSLTPPSASFQLNSVAGGVVPQLLDSTTGLYHTLAILNDGGVLTLQLSDQGYAAAAATYTGGTFRLYGVGGVVAPQLQDTTTGLFHTLAILNDGGVLTLQLSDTGY